MWRYVLSAVSLCCLILVSCAPATNRSLFPVVQMEAQLEPVSFRVDVLRVQTDYAVMSGYDEPSTPNHLDKAIFLRYYLPAEDVKTILVLMPGIFNGATNLDILARQFVAALPNTQVWVIDRRANLLEDRSRFIESLEQQDPMIAYDYYVTNVQQQGGFQALTADEVTFMSDWGLETHLRDLHEVIKVANDSADTVILGGYSLGASMVSYYSSYLFENQAGQAFIDGLFLIDGALGITGGFNREPEKLSLGPFELMPGLEQLEQGTSSPYLTTAFSPQAQAESQVSYLLARFQPDDLAPGQDRAYPATNRAVVGIAADDAYSSSVPFGWSVGEAVGATTGGNLFAVLASGRAGAGNQSVVGVAKGHEHVDWSRAYEPCNLDTYVKNASTFETDSSEWYFPVRLILDMFSYDMRLENNEDFIPTRTVTVPTLAVGAERGLASSLDKLSAYNNLRLGSSMAMYVLPDYTHVDIAQAENNPLVGYFEVWSSNVSSSAKRDSDTLVEE